jgi:hypothetical protein
MGTLDTSSTSAGLIAGKKVSGTTVYDTAGEKLGTVEDVMIDKLTGRIAYAIMSFGGFLGIGDKHHPLPWSTLKYDPGMGGYVVNIDKRTLEGGPVFKDDEMAWQDQNWVQSIHKYYGTEPYRSPLP